MPDASKTQYARRFDVTVSRKNGVGGVRVITVTGAYRVYTDSKNHVLTVESYSQVPRVVLHQRFPLHAVLEWQEREYVIALPAAPPPQETAQD